LHPNTEGGGGEGGKGEGEGDEDEYDVPEEIESVIELLLVALRDKVRLHPEFCCVRVRVVGLRLLYGAQSSNKKLHSLEERH
jgi:hypothetical protein